ncbi:hypothetical protein [Sinorhizobium sp. NFACC03]|nr:hypothetical protein [Sinorhizobium sp. NFACC03]
MLSYAISEGRVPFYNLLARQQKGADGGSPVASVQRVQCHAD